MELSRNLLKRFADITNDLKDRTRPVLAVYGTAVVLEEREDVDPDIAEEVTEEENDINDNPIPAVKKIKYVRIDGSDILTPVLEATDIQDGDRVMVSIQDHAATVIGNVTCPPSARTATDLDPLLEEQSVRIDTLIAGQITTVYLDANYAKIDRLEAQSARIGVLEAGRITTEYLEANYAKIDRLEAQSARIGVLEAGRITTEHLKANFADIELANITQASIGRLFADIGLVSNMVISQGQITGELQGVKISASQLTAGRIDAADIEVVNLNASNITVGTINGQFIRPGTITSEALSAELNNAILEKVDIQEALDQIEANKAAAEKMIGDMRSELGTDGSISVAGGNISSNSITTEKIATNAITSDKIAADSVTAGKMSVATLSSITADVGTLTAGIIKSSNHTVLEGAVVLPYSRTGMLINLSTGLIQTPNFVVDASGNAYISGTIYASAGQIAGSLVTSGISANNITAGTLSADRIAAGSISGSKLIAGTITATQIAASAVTSDKIAANSITSGKIAANAVTATQISAGAVTANKIAAGAITADKLNVSGLSAISANIGTITSGEFGGFTISDKGIVATNKNEPYIFIYPGTEPVIGIEDRYGSYVRIEKTGVQSDTIKCLNIMNKNNIVDQTINLDGENKSFVFSGGHHIRLETDVTTEVGIRIKNPKVSNYLSFIISAAGNKGIYDNNDTTWIIMKNTSNVVYIPAVYSKTTTGSANVNVNSSGALCRYTSSSQRYKHDIRYFSNTDNAVSAMSKRNTQDAKDSELLSILRLPVCSFLYNSGYVNGDINYDPDRPIYGFIAEDVEHVSPDAVEYYVEPPKYDSMDREMSPERNTMIPESWDMKKLFPKAVYVLQKHEDEIKRYKAALTLLYSAVDKAGLLDLGIKEHISQMIA